MTEFRLKFQNFDIQTNQDSFLQYQKKSVNVTKE